MTAQTPINPAHAALRSMSQAELQRAATILWDALHAANEEARHMQQVFGGWQECADCQAANDQCDGSLACDASKERSRIVSNAWTLR